MTHQPDDSSPSPSNASPPCESSTDNRNNAANDTNAVNDTNAAGVANAAVDTNARPGASCTAPVLTDEQRLDLCEELVGHKFANRQLLLEALTHASGASHRMKSNERMEFLGDAILGAVVCDWLYHERVDLAEGELTKIKSSVVSRKTCSAVARRIGLDRCLLVGKGVRKNHTFPKSLTSDVFEAIVAAIYLDGGMEKIRQILRSWLAEDVASAIEMRGNENHKSILQQIVQRDFSTTPNYRLLSEVGPDHSKQFEIAVVVDGEQRTPAWGKSKKDAEQRAAANALAELSGNDPPYRGRPI